MLLEGCQSITAEYWQCDYRAEWLWMREVQTLSAVGHVLHVLPRWFFGDSDNVLDVLSCSTAVLELWGCSGAPIQGGGDGVSVPSADDSGEIVQPDSEPSSTTVKDLRELSRIELSEGPGAQGLSVSKLLREFGVIRLLESCLIDIPPAADFLFRFELFAASSANRHFYADADAAGDAMFAFESRMRHSARAAAESLPGIAGSSVLDDAFFEVFERCGRESAWSDVDLFEVHNGRKFDVLPERIEPEFGVSQFEYLQLRHECARYAATYPTLDPAVRDELLAPQRAHYARVILDRLDNVLPVVEVPPEYQTEVDELRKNGW